MRPNPELYAVQYECLFHPGTVFLVHKTIADWDDSRNEFETICDICDFEHIYEGPNRIPLGDGWVLTKDCVRCGGDIGSYELLDNAEACAECHRIIKEELGT